MKIKKHFAKDLDDSFATTEEFIANLQAEVQEARDGGWENLHFDLSAEDDSCYFQLVGSRLETEEEELVREQLARNAQLMFEQRERDTYERLKKKYGHPMDDIPNLPV